MVYFSVLQRVAKPDELFLDDIGTSAITEDLH